MVKFGPSFGIRWYGFSYLLAFFCGFLLLRWLAQRRYCALPAAKVGDFILLASLGVVVGGRLGFVLFYRPAQFLADPLFLFRVWDGGMSSHGGMIGLTLVTFLYARRQHISWLSLADNIAVVAPVGLFLGRCANFINGELYGRATTVPWAMQFPKEALDLPEIGARTLAAAHAVQPTVGGLEEVIEQARDRSKPAIRLPPDVDPASSVADLRSAPGGRISLWLSLVSPPPHEATARDAGRAFPAPLRVR